MLAPWFLLTACSLFDQAPPSVRASVGPGPHREPFVVQITADDPSGLVARVEVGGRRVAVVDGQAEVDPRGLGHGPVSLTVVATDGSPWEHQARVELTTLVDTTPPELRLHPARAGVGRSVALWVEASEPLVQPRVAVFDTERPLHPVGERYRAMVGIGLRTEPGPAEVTVTAHDAAGNLAQVDGTLVVDPVDYPVRGHIRLTREQVAARNDDEAKATMRSERDAAYALARPDALWEAPFTVPLRGRQTSPFGAFRTYSDGDRSYHTGVDLTNRRGTEVVAAARGEVVVAHEQAIHGNAVILHHGQGVTSSYSHLRQIDVAVGDRVEPGQRLGIMGSTGQSTGPHLHFGMVVSGRAVDPTQWLTGDPSAFVHSNPQAGHDGVSAP